MITQVEKAIYVKLFAASGVTSLLSIPAAIFNKQAPEKIGSVPVLTPYIIYTHAAGGQENETPLDTADIRYYIQGVATSASAASAIGDAIEAALHRPSSMAFDTPWNMVQCQLTTVISRMATVDRVDYHYAGGLYKIQISK